ncbi:MAG: OmpA family protein [Gammaproteobacteria bacterium]|nr:OmpA family protein [Gammaproteobacteria bacterium]
MNKNNKLSVKILSIITFSLVFQVLFAGCALTKSAKTDAAVTKIDAAQADAVAFKGQSNLLADDDNDGVINTDDNCKDTLPATLVDIKGCALDTDGDTVADSHDACRGTPRGVKVDERGCGFDDDQDGVPDYRDRCGNTIRDVSVDGNGCEWDSDNDGVVDSKDLCAGTPPGVKVEYMGCHVIEVVTLLGVHFTTGSDELSASAQKTLQGVAKTLLEHPRMRVEVAGHTDNTGSDTINQQLSLNRARMATQFLVDLGISPKVLTTRGYAATQPVSSNDSQEGRSLNRRVEMRFVEID